MGPALAITQSSITRSTARAPAIIRSSYQLVNTPRGLSFVITVTGRTANTPSVIAALCFFITSASTATAAAAADESAAPARQLHAVMSVHPSERSSSLFAHSQRLDDNLRARPRILKSRHARTIRPAARSEHRPLPKIGPHAFARILYEHGSLLLARCKVADH
jgi:hypothetical protein